MGEWIPVTERLPEEDGRYIVSHEGGVEVAWYTSDNDGQFEVFCEYYNCPEYFDTDAWMPFPEPYKEVDAK